METLENKTELVKGEWYIIEPYGRDLCLLQYNDDEDCTGWWNGIYKEHNWDFTEGGLGTVATPAPLELLREKGLAI